MPHPSQVRGLVYAGVGHGHYAQCQCKGQYDGKYKKADPTSFPAIKGSDGSSSKPPPARRWRPSLTQAPDVEQLQAKIFRPKIAWRRLSCRVRAGSLFSGMGAVARSRASTPQAWAPDPLANAVDSQL